MVPTYLSSVALSGLYSSIVFALLVALGAVAEARSAPDMGSNMEICISSLLIIQSPLEGKPCRCTVHVHSIFGRTARALLLVLHYAHAIDEISHGGVLFIGLEVERE
jgi:hypothetical protein